MSDAPRTWKGMVEWNQALLLRKTAHDVRWWADLAREQGLPDNAALAESILAWAETSDGVVIQMRKGYVSLQSRKRKFAQVTAGTKSAVDVTLRWDGVPHERLEPIKVRADDPFSWRIRLRTIDDVDDEFFALLTAALAQNS